MNGSFIIISLLVGSSFALSACQKNEPPSEANKPSTPSKIEPYSFETMKDSNNKPIYASSHIDTPSICYEKKDAEKRIDIELKAEDSFVTETLIKQDIDKGGADFKINFFKREREKILKKETQELTTESSLDEIISPSHGVLNPQNLLISPIKNRFYISEEGEIKFETTFVEVANENYKSIVIDNKMKMARCDLVETSYRSTSEERSSELILYNFNGVKIKAIKKTTKQIGDVLCVLDKRPSLNNDEVHLYSGKGEIEITNIYSNNVLQIGFQNCDGLGNKLYSKIEVKTDHQVYYSNGHSLEKKLLLSKTTKLVKAPVRMNIIKNNFN